MIGSFFENSKCKTYRTFLVTIFNTNIISMIEHILHFDCNSIDLCKLGTTMGMVLTRYY